MYGHPEHGPYRYYCARCGEERGAFDAQDNVSWQCPRCKELGYVKVEAVKSNGAKDGAVHATE